MAQPGSRRPCGMRCRREAGDEGERLGDAIMDAASASAFRSWRGHRGDRGCFSLSLSFLSSLSPSTPLSLLSPLIELFRVSCEDESTQAQCR